MLKKIIYANLLTLASLNSFAISTTTRAQVSDGIALYQIQAYAQSSTKSQKVGVVEPGTALIEHKNFLKTKPGMAMMEEQPKDKSVPFDRGAHVYIWEYLEQGFSKVIINNIPYTTKIARSKSECKRVGASPKYCWARVIEEPEYYEWKQVSLEQKSQRFWVLNRIIDGSGVVSVKDEAISQTRLINKKTVVVDKSTKEDEETTEEVKTEQDNAALFSPEIITDANLPEDPFQRAFVENMMKPKSEVEKEKKAKRDEEKAKLEDEAKLSNISQEDMFKQQNINESNSLNANMNNASTQTTINQVNKEFDTPATKLELKANQPLTLPIVN